MLDDTDKEALADMRRKGRKGFIALYHRYAGRVKSYLLWHCRLDEETAEELCNEVFFKFCHNIDKFNEKCGIHTWLCRIARNEVLNHLRKREVEYVPLSSSTANTADDADTGNSNPYDNQPDDKIPDIVRQICYEQCMDRLLGELQKSGSHKDCLNALTLRAMGVSIESIAEKIGRTTGATKTFLSTTCMKIMQQGSLKRCMDDCKE